MDTVNAAMLLASLKFFKKKINKLKNIKDFMIKIYPLK